MNPLFSILFLFFLTEPVSEQLLNSLVVREILDGAECCQFLLQGDDFKGQVAGRQDQEAHSGGNSREECCSNIFNSSLQSSESLEMSWESVFQGGGCSVCIAGFGQVAGGLTEAGRRPARSWWTLVLDWRWSSQPLSLKTKQIEQLWKLPLWRGSQAANVPSVPATCVFRCLLSEFCLWALFFTLCWRSRFSGAALLCVRFSASRYGETGNSARWRWQPIRREPHFSPEHFEGSKLNKIASAIEVKVCFGKTYSSAKKFSGVRGHNPTVVLAPLAWNHLVFRKFWWTISFKRTLNPNILAEDYKQRA